MRDRRCSCMLSVLVLLMLAAPGAAQTDDPPPAPRVVRTVPAHGDAAVDPALTEIRVEFDQDMDQGRYSWVGGGPTFPKTSGRPRWISPRICVLPVKLEPDSTYWLGMNSSRHTNFRSVAGVAATPAELAFRTAGIAADPENPDAPAAPVGTAVSPELNHASTNELRRLIDDAYSYRDLRPVRWAELFREFKDPLRDAPTLQEFARTAGRMLSRVQDPHIWLEVEGVRFAAFKRERPVMSFRVTLLERIVPDWTQRSRTVWTGQFEDGIGYIMVSSFSSSFSQDLEAAFEAIESMREAPGIILDVRPNGGGDELLARELAGCFVEKPVVYAKNVYRAVDAQGGFTHPPYERLVEPAAGRPEYRGRVAVLMGPSNMSSCEAFLLMMKQVKAATLVGRRSYGSSGNPRPHTLPNGVVIYLPSWKAMFPDETLLESRGIDPDVHVTWSGTTPPTEHDAVLDAALQHLRN